MRIILLALLLTGCQSLPTMNADAIKAVPQGGAMCASTDSIWGKAKLVYINAARGVIPNGGIDASADCTLSMRNVAVQRLSALPPMPDPTPDPTPSAPPK